MKRSNFFCVVVESCSIDRVQEGVGLVVEIGERRGVGGGSERRDNKVL